MPNFWSDNHLPHYHAKPTWNNGIGYLVDSRGISVPGITTIMKATKSPQEKAQLANWRQRVGASDANRISRTSRDRGYAGECKAYKFNEETPI